MSYYKLLLLTQAYTEGTKTNKEKEVEEKENLRTMSAKGERKIKGKEMHLLICQNNLSLRSLQNPHAVKATSQISLSNPDTCPFPQRARFLLSATL